MKFRVLFSVVLLIFSMLNSLAQEGSRVANPIRRELHPITGAQIILDGTTLQLVITGELPDGCARPAIVNSERVGAVWFIDLYRELPFDAECTAIIQPYEERLNAKAIAADRDTDPIQVVVINGRYFGVEPGETDTLPQLSDLWVRGPLPYNMITTRHTQEGDMEITLSGVLTDGCAVPVYRAVADWQNEGFVMVEAYTAISIAAMCAQVNTPFEAVFRSPVFESIAINGVGVPFNPALSVDLQAFREDALPVTDVTTEWVEGLLPNLKITVSGVIDGCEDPVQLVPQLPVDNTYLIKVVRVLRADAACPEIARDFKAEVYISPLLGTGMPIVLFVGDQVVEVESE